jgi:subtilase family serine protease
MTMNAPARSFNRHQGHAYIARSDAMRGMTVVLAVMMVLPLAFCGNVLAFQDRDPGTIDLEVSGQNITVTPPQPGPPRLNDNLSISIDLNNLGTDATTNVSLIFSYNTTDTVLATIETAADKTIPGLATIAVTVYWNTSGLGLEAGINYSIWVQALTDPNITDANSSNNMASTVMVFSPDVIPVIQELTADTYSAHVGDSIGLEARLNNVGIRPALCESISFFLDSSPSPFAQKNANLLPGTPVTVQVLWSSTSALTDGNHTVTATVRGSSQAIQISFRYWTNPHFASIQASTYSANVGDRLYINVTLENNGTDNATQVPVNYYIDSGGVPVGNLTVDNVPAGQQTHAAFLWDTYFMSPPLVPGNHTVKARIAGTSKEIRTANVTMGPQLLPDLVVSAFTVSKARAFIGEVLEVNITVVNSGQTAPHFNSTLQVVINSVDPIDETIIPQLAPGESFNHSFGWDTRGLDAKVYSLRAQADQFDEIRESNESNNAMKLEASFSGAVDLAVESILFTPYQNLTNLTTNVTAGDGLWVWVTVANRGTIGSAPNTTLAVYMDGSTAPLRTFTLYSISAGRNFTFDMPLSTAQFLDATTASDHRIRAVVDVNRQNEDVSWENNEMNATLTVFPRISAPDLVVLELKPSKTAVGYEEGILLNAHVANFGGTTARNVTLRFTFRAAGSPQRIGDIVIPQMRPGEHFNRTQVWTVLVSEGNYTLEAVLDPQNAVAGNHSRNTASAVVTVRPGEDQGPDVAVTNITTNPGDPADGEKVIVSITIRNRGHTSAADITLTLLVNGRPAGNASLAELAPGAVRTLDIFWTAHAGMQRMAANVTGANFQPVTGDVLGLEVAKAPSATVGYMPVVALIIILLIVACALLVKGTGAAPPGKEEEEE